MNRLKWAMVRVGSVTLMFEIALYLHGLLGLRGYSPVVRVKAAEKSAKVSVKPQGNPKKKGRKD